MALTALLLIALLLPGCVLSLSNGQVDHGPQRGLLDALQKLRLLNLANGRQQNRRYAIAPAQHQQSQQVLVDIANASQNVSVYPDLDSLLRSRLKRDQSLMVQINVFNSAGRGCWHRRTASPSTAFARAKAGSTPSSVEYAPTDTSAKAVLVSLGEHASKVPWVHPGTSSVATSTEQRVGASRVDYNGSTSAVVENATVGAPEMNSFIPNVQNEKDVIHSLSAPSVTFEPPTSYSREAPATLIDDLSRWKTGSESPVTSDLAALEQSNPVPFFPKQSFDQYPAKPAYKIFNNAMTVRLRPPPPLIKVTFPVLIPSRDEFDQPDLAAITDSPREPEGDTLNDPSGCLQSFSLGLNCNENIYRGKVSGVPNTPFGNIIRKPAVQVERRNMDRSAGIATELCECDDVNKASAKNKNSFKPSDMQELLFKPQDVALQRLRSEIQQKAPAKILGSLRFPAPSDIAYEYATTYVYEDYVPSAYYDAQPQRQPLPLLQRPPQQQGQDPSRQQPLPMLRVGINTLAAPGGNMYELRNATNHVPGALAVDHRPRRLKSRNGTRTSTSPLRRIARDLQALEAKAQECPCASTRKPPCTKTPKKCVKKRPCTKKVKKCTKRCRKKTQKPNAMPVPLMF